MSFDEDDSWKKSEEKNLGLQCTCTTALEEKRKLHFLHWHLSHSTLSGLEYKVYLEIPYSTYMLTAHGTKYKQYVGQECLGFSFFLPSLVYTWIYGWIKDCQMILFISTCKVYKVIHRLKPGYLYALPVGNMNQYDGAEDGGGGGDISLPAHQPLIMVSTLEVFSQENHH